MQSLTTSRLSRTGKKNSAPCSYSVKKKDPRSRTTADRSPHVLRTIAFVTVAIFLFMPLAQADQINPMDHNAHTAIIRVNNQIIRLESYGENIIRVTRIQGETIPTIASLAILAQPAIDGWTTSSTDETYELATKLIQAQVDLRTGNVTFLDQSQATILREAGSTFNPAYFNGSKSSCTIQRFVLNDDEAIFGLGQHPEGRWDYRGSTVHLQQKNGDTAVPVLLSSTGYGILWDNPAITDVHVGIPGDEKNIVWNSEAGEAIDYFFMYGPSADEVIHGYRYLTGDVPMFSRWAWGFWQCRERYRTKEELLGVAREYRKRQIPIDGIIQDWQYWTPNPWGSHAFDEERFPNPKAMMEELHTANFHAIISVWPKFDKGSDNYKAMEAAGCLFPPVYPNVWPRGEAKWYDAYDANARNLYWQQMSQQLFSLGFDGWWLDATEPELGGKWGELRDISTAAGPGYSVFNAYPLMTTSTGYDGQRAQSDDKRVFILTRSAYSGMQRNAATAWSGDIGSDWETFKRQIPAGLNFVLTGIPYWNTDIGGFFSRSPTDPDYQECFTRWFQFGAFCPMFRVHGTNAKKEMWEFGPNTEAILIKYDRLRYRLLPYLYSVAWQVTHGASSMMRPLVMDFPKDPQAVHTPDQFLFGPAIMVCPVTEPIGGVGTVIPATYLIDNKGNPGGLSATYYQGREFEEKKLERRDVGISFNWDKEKREGVGDNPRRDPLLGMQMDHFSARWEGSLQTREAGTYLFELSADDGMRLWIDGHLVIEDWNARSIVTRTAEVALPAETRVPIKVEYFQYAGEATIELRWKPPADITQCPTRKVYLPEGEKWWDFWTGKCLPGGKMIDAPAPIDIMPLYIRPGSIIPMGRVVQHAGEQPDPIELRVYRGKSGSFTFYEDAGDGYAYEKGEYAETPIHWDEDLQTLTIGPRTGTFPGMSPKHTYHVIFVEENYGVGIDLTEPVKIVTLEGSKQVQLKPPTPDTRTTVTVKTKTAARPISPDLFGIFFEDINYAADGGLYAELVQNRSFEYQPTEQITWNAVTSWEFLTREGGRGWWVVDDVGPIHSNNPHYVVLHVDHPGKGVGIANLGYDGIPIRAGADYEVSLFARQLYMNGRWEKDSSIKGRPMPLILRLETPDGKVIAETSLAVAGDQWHRVAGTMKANESTENARLVLLATQRGGIGVDVVSLFPRNTFRGRRNGLRKDLAQVIADLKPRFVRFPGGCLVHGDGISNMYHWKYTVGPIEQRKEQRNIWRYHQTTGLGYLEYFQFCEDIGAKPLPIVSAGVCCQNSGQVGGKGQRGIALEEMPQYIQDVLDLIEWANGPADSFWGSRRASAGHPLPFNLEYIGVGNEDRITPAFRERFGMIYDAIQARHPEITVIGTVGPLPDGEDFIAGWEIARKLKVPVVDEHFYKPPQWFWDYLTRYDTYDRSGPHVYVGEYAAHDTGRRNTLRSALAEAAFMTGLEKNGDIVMMASYAPLFGKVGKTQWNPDLIYFTDSHILLTINYYVQRMFSQNAGDISLATRIDNPQENDRIAVSAVSDTKSEDTILKIVNGDSKTCRLRIELSDAEPVEPEATLTRLEGRDPMMANDLNSAIVVPQESTIEVSTEFNYNAPPYSLSVIRLKTKHCRIL